MLFERWVRLAIMMIRAWREKDFALISPRSRTFPFDNHLPPNTVERGRAVSLSVEARQECAPNTDSLACCGVHRCVLHFAPRYQPPSLHPQLPRQRRPATPPCAPGMRLEPFCFKAFRERGCRHRLVAIVPW